MTHRLVPVELFRGHWKALSDYRDRRPVADGFTRAALIVLPLTAGVLTFFFGSLTAPGALLTGVALLAGGFLAAFAQIASIRLRLTERAAELPQAEQVDRDSLDETASHLLVASYLSGITALVLIIGMNVGADRAGAIHGLWAGLSVAFASYVLLTFLICLPRLYTAYATFNAVRVELSGTHHGRL